MEQLPEDWEVVGILTRLPNVYVLAYYGRTSRFFHQTSREPAELYYQGRSEVGEGNERS